MYLKTNNMTSLLTIVLKKFPNLCTKGVNFLKCHKESVIESIVVDSNMNLERFILYMSAVGVKRSVIRQMLDSIIDNINDAPEWCPHVFSLVKDKRTRYTTNYGDIVIFNETWDNNFFKLVAIVSCIVEREIPEHIRSHMEYLIIDGFYRKQKQY